MLLGCGGIIGGDDVRDCELAVRLKDSLHLPDHVLRVRDVMNGKPGHRDVSGGIAQRKAFGIAAQERDVVESLGSGGAAALGEHGRRVVEDDDAFHPRSHGTSHQAGAAGDVQRNGLRIRFNERSRPGHVIAAGYAGAHLVEAISLAAKAVEDVLAIVGQSCLRWKCYVSRRVQAKPGIGRSNL